MVLKFCVKSSPDVTNTFIYKMTSEIPMADQNFNALAKMNKDKYEGKCIGMANGKVVIVGIDPIKVMDDLIKNYAGKSILVTSVPRRDVNFVL